MKRLILRDYVKQIQTNGFAIFDNIIDPEAVSKLRNELEAVSLEYSSVRLPGGLEWYGT